MVGESALRHVSRCRQSFGPLYAQVGILASWADSDERAAADLDAWAKEEAGFLGDIAEYAGSQAEALEPLTRKARERGSTQLAASVEAFRASEAAALTAAEEESHAGAAEASAAEGSVP